MQYSFQPRCENYAAEICNETQRHLSFPGPADFTVSPMTIIISQGTSVPTFGFDCASLTAAEDDALEGMETFDIVINGTDVPEVTVGTLNTLTVSIIDTNGTPCEQLCM